MRVYTTMRDRIKEILDKNGEKLQVLPFTEENIPEINDDDVVILGNRIGDDLLYSQLFNKRLLQWLGENNKGMNIPVVICLVDRETNKEEIINTGFFVISDEKNLNKDFFETLKTLKDYFSSEYEEEIIQFIDRINLYIQLQKEAVYQMNLGVNGEEKKINVEFKAGSYRDKAIIVFEIIRDDVINAFPVQVQLKKLVYEGQEYSLEELEKTLIQKLSKKDDAKNFLKRVFNKRVINKEFAEKMRDNKELQKQNSGEENRPTEITIQNNGISLIYEVLDISRQVYVVYTDNAEQSLFIKERELCSIDPELYCFRIDRFVDFIFIPKDEEIKTFIEKAFKDYKTLDGTLHGIKFVQWMDILQELLIKRPLRSPHTTELLSNMLELVCKGLVDEFDKYLTNLISRKLAGYAYFYIKNKKNSSELEHIKKLFHPYELYIVENLFNIKLVKKVNLLKLLSLFICEKNKKNNKDEYTIPEWAKVIEYSIYANLSNRKTWKGFIDFFKKRIKYSISSERDGNDPEGGVVDEKLFHQNQEIFIPTEETEKENQLKKEELHEMITQLPPLSFLKLLFRPILNHPKIKKFSIKDEYIYESLIENKHLCSNSVEDFVAFYQLLSKKDILHKWKVSQEKDCPQCSCPPLKDDGINIKYVYAYLILKLYKDSKLYNELYKKIQQKGDINEFLRLYGELVDGIRYAVDWCDTDCDKLDNLNKTMLYFWGCLIFFILPDIDKIYLLKDTPIGKELKKKKINIDKVYEYLQSPSIPPFGNYNLCDYNKAYNTMHKITKKILQTLDNKEDMIDGAMEEKIS